MSRVSIFHRLVSREPTYTQLLLNMLHTDPLIRVAVLRAIFDGCPAETVLPEHIRSEVLLPDNNGRPDLLVENNHMIGIVEIKFGAPLQDSQTDKNEKCYLSFLRGKTKDAWFTFLVPATYPLSLVACEGVKQNRVNWEQLRVLFKELALESVIASEFHLLLSERFGSISMTDAEVRAFSGDFPFREAIRLIRLVNGVRRNLTQRMKCEDSEPDDYGFYLRSGKFYILYFGCWPDFSDERHEPLCFGVREESKSGIKGIATEFRKQFPRATELGDWVLDSIPQHLLTESNAEESVAAFLTEVYGSFDSLPKNVVY